MRTLDGQQVLMRIFVGEADKHGGKPLYKAVVELLREEKIAGATVVRGVLGYGANSHVHSGSLLRLSQDLPMVVEAVDTRENVERVMPQIESLVTQGLITLEDVHVVRYAAGPLRSE
jgi:PII-like signaling protein